MSNEDKNARSNALIDDDDDFLDSMMEDLMGPSSNDAESEPAEPTPVSKRDAEDNSETAKASPESEVEQEVHIEVEDTIEEEEYIEPVRKPRRGGLLNRFSGAANTSAEVKEEPSKEIESESSEGQTSTSDEREKESVAEEPTEKRRAPLLNRVPRVKEVETEDDLWGTDGDSLEEAPATEPKLEVVNDRLQVDSADSSEESSSSFDDMLDGFDDDEDINKVRRKAELDPDVLVPLEKPGMDQIAVTADGKTLADMLPGLRAGSRPIHQVVSEIKNQDKVVQVGDKKFADSRYSKHLTVIDEEALEDEKRVALSMKFLQRNAEFTEQEKIIMKNLGLTNDQLSKVMRSTELSMKQKEDIIGLGRYGAEKHFKGRRYRTTVGDSAMLEFLVKFKVSNTRILRWISNEPQGRTWRKLSRLRNSGLVESQSLIGVPDLWAATQSGVAIAGYDLPPGLKPMPKISTIASDMGVNYIAACLWFNSVNVLNLDDFPAHNKVISLQNDGRDRVRGESLVSELEIRSSLGKEINPVSTTMPIEGDRNLYDLIASNINDSIEEWNADGKVGDGPETQLGNEYMWVLFPIGQLTIYYHVPDLIVKRERGPNGEPRSIAIEVERYEKAKDRYDKIMLAYKMDEHLYEEVIWITPNTRVARALEQAAEAVGFDRYSIIPIITEDGVYDKQDIWMI